MTAAGVGHEGVGYDAPVGGDSAYPRWPWRLGTVLSLIGLAIAAYLTYEHYTGSRSLACPALSTGINCLKVTTSPWSREFGMPVSVLGLAFFVVMLVLQSPWAWGRPELAVRAVRLGWCVVGLGNAVVLIYDELVKIDAICEWCTAVHVLTFLIFVATVFGTISTDPLPEEQPDGDGPGTDRRPLV